MKWQIPYAGTTWVLDDSRFTASEARLQKRLTGGWSLTEAENKRLELDGDAWIAALAIARRRTGMSADEAIEIDLDELDLMPIMKATEDAARADQAAAAEAKPARKDRRTVATPAEAEAEPEAKAEPATT